MLPCLGGVRPMMLFMVVVLPAPFRPKRQTISPGSKWELYVYGFVAERMISDGMIAD
jgi:hypothetical protein